MRTESDDEAKAHCVVEAPRRQQRPRWTPPEIIARLRVALCFEEQEQITNPQKKIKDRLVNECGDVNHLEYRNKLFSALGIYSSLSTSMTSTMIHDSGYLVPGTSR